MPAADGNHLPAGLGTPLIEPTVGDRASVPVRKRQHIPTTHIQRELLKLRVAGSLQPVSERPRSQAEIAPKALPRIGSMAVTPGWQDLGLEEGKRA